MLETFYKTFSDLKDKNSSDQVQQTDNLYQSMFTKGFITKSCEKNKMSLLEQGYLTRMNFNKQ